MRATSGVGAGPATVACALALACLGALVPDAQAAETGSQMFTTAGEHTFVVPAGVTSLQVIVVGGNGAAGSPGKSGFHAPGGVGASAMATLAVSPGQTLFGEVAGNGQANGIGGYGGGGSGSHTGETAGGGGGASDVRTCSISAIPSGCASGSSLASRLLVAGGGGGGGRGGSDTGDADVIKAGAGGGASSDGSAGAADGKGDNGGDGGLQGEQGAPGEAGENSEEPGTAGALGAGGNGGSSFAAVGGGGGGGIFGGGGGGGGLTSVDVMSNVFNSAGGGGGGGSSGIPSGAIGVSEASTGPGSQPSVSFTWTLPPPAAVTDPSQAITAASATLTGTVNPDGSSVTDCHFTVSPAPPAGATIPCQQQVGAESLPVAVSAALAGLSPATTYTVTLQATSAQGSASGSPVTFVTSAAGGSFGPGVGSSASSALTVTNLELSPTRFRRGMRAAKLAKTRALPTATTISFVLSGAATVILSFEQAHAGVLVAHKCLAISKARRKGRSCKRYTAVPHRPTLSAPAGKDRITFDGVLGGASRLAPGSYRLSLTASATGARATAKQRPTFTLVA